MNKRDAKFLAGKGWKADGLQARNAWAPTKQGPKGAWHEAEKKEGHTYTRYGKDLAQTL